jgi:tRNA threonylcarbamoyladenosine biosynthesis protein TsaE
MMRQADAFLTTRKEEETAHIGKILGRALYEPLVVALEGELGAGKTVFARGAAAGFEVTAQVSSPTFVLLKIYEGRMPVYHFDFYRLSPGEETDELGFDEYLPGDGVAFVEWSDRLPEYLPEEYLQVSIEIFFDQQGEGRRIWFTPYGDVASEVVETIIEAVTWCTNGTLDTSPEGK